MEDFWLNLSLLLVIGGIVFLLFSGVEQPIARAKIREQPERSLLHLAKVLKQRSLPVKQVDHNKGELRIKAVRKLLDLALYRCWSKELVFRIERNNDLVVVGKPSPWKAKTQHPMTDAQLEQIVREVADDFKLVPPV